MNRAVYGIANTAQQANAIVERLQSTGFSSDDISVLFPDRAGKRDFAHERNTKAPEGAAVGGAAGLGLGGALGLLAGIGLLAIPDVGAFIVAGPIMAALSGAAVGGATGGLLGGLVGMGMPEYEAKLYDDKVRAGNILICVHTEDVKSRSRAMDVFEAAGAHDVSTSAEPSAPTQ